LEQIMDFQVLQRAVAAQFERMCHHPLFRVDVDKEELWQLYLKSFPAGTNEVFRERREYDCSCCRQFFRAVGDLVAIIDGKLSSVWDVMTVDEPHYQPVVDALRNFIKTKPIAAPFLHYERAAGVEKTFEEVTGEAPRRWNHFFVNIPAAYVKDKDLIATKLSEMRGDFDVLHRGLRELTPDAVDTVADLIAQNSLYRGAEHKFAVEGFQKLQRKCPTGTMKAVELFAWEQSVASGSDVHPAIKRIRNSAIGTLLVDLSKGEELEDAVNKFERSIMAPSNYKRPTALISKAQIEKAKATLQELGLTSALDRRFAVLKDIKITNILFADRNARKAIGGDVFDELETKGPKKAFDKVEELPIEKFITDVLPRIESMEVFFENGQSGNLVSLIAPADPTAGLLFKWPNPFSWSYNGDMADSIKERVKRAGGAVTGDLCCRLAWDYADDLDFHMHEPNGTKINFSTYLRHKSPNGGVLDLDANGRDGVKAEPAENIVYDSRSRMSDGVYTLFVNNYSRRSDGQGFTVEVEFDGQTHSFGYEKALRGGETILIAKIKKSSKGFEIIESLPSTTSSRTVWGLATQRFHRVSLLTLSPNHWDKPIGNKHYFFMVNGCTNDGTARGFYNEFLKEELNAHRKVFEVVGSKMKFDGPSEQLSGLGFSSTQRSSLVCRVKGSFSRTLKLVF
jgi:hypothetical protein